MSGPGIAPITGDALVQLAKTRLGQKYILGAQVPKDNPNWNGPWDCAEFTSWVFYQVTHQLYGCNNDHGNPSTAAAFTGYWKRDAESIGAIITLEQAARTPGAFVLRFPQPAPPATSSFPTARAAPWKPTALPMALFAANSKIVVGTWGFCRPASSTEGARRRTRGSCRLSPRESINDRSRRIEDSAGLDRQRPGSRHSRRRIRSPHRRRRPRLPNDQRPYTRRRSWARYRQGPRHKTLTPTF